MAHRRRSYRSLITAFRDPARSDFAFIPQQYISASAVDLSTISPNEITPIKSVCNTEQSYEREHGPKSTSRLYTCLKWNHNEGKCRQGNRVYISHIVAIGMSSFCCIWLTQFPLSPNRLYNMQVDVFNTNHEHTIFFFKQCLYLGMILGAASTGYLGDRLGRAGTLELASVPYVMGWLLLGLFYGEVAVLIGRYMLGVSAGMISVIAPIYVAEVTDAVSRGRGVVAAQGMFTLLGKLFYLVVGAVFLLLTRVYTDFNLSEWKILAVLGLIPGILLLLFTQRLPDSPTWLIIRHNDREGAFNVLSQLMSDDFGRAELKANCIIHAFTLSQQNRTNHGEFFRPLLLCSILFMFRAVTTYLVDPTLSSTPSKTFMVTVLGVGLDMPAVEILHAMAYLWAATCIGLLFCFNIVDSRGRVMALCIGSSMVVIGCIISLVQVYTNNEIHSPQYQYISHLGRFSGIGSATLLMITIGHHMGLGLTPIILASELYPPRQRVGAMSLLIILDTTTSLALSYILPFLREMFSLEYVFTFCIGVILLCNAGTVVIAWLYVPESSVRSLESIEAIFSGWHPQTPQQYSQYGVSVDKSYGTMH